MGPAATSAPGLVPGAQALGAAEPEDFATAAVRSSVMPLTNGPRSTTLVVTNRPR